MKIAADACIYTNHNFVIETLENTAPTPGDADGMVAPAAAAAAEKAKAKGQAGG